MSVAFQIQFISDNKQTNTKGLTLFTQPGAKQLNDFLRTVTLASDLIDCTLVNCECYLYMNT